MTALKLDDLKSSEKDAFGLVQAAVALDDSRSDKRKLAAALDHNMQLWVAIETMTKAADAGFPEAVKKNLQRLSSFVADTTLKNGVAMGDDTVTTLVNINLQISEGLLEGAV